METRNVKLTLDKAKEWYRKGGELKEVALQAFKEEELKEKHKPRSWEEYCYGDIAKKNGFYIEETSTIRTKSRHVCLNSNIDKNVLPTKELAGKFLAYMQLMSLRQAWIGNWEPDWSKITYCIATTDSGIFTGGFSMFTRSLSFPTHKMADEFLNCFKDLLEQAKGLY